MKKGEKTEKSRTMRLLRVILLAIFACCIAVFIWMCSYMLNKNRKAIGQVGQIFTSQMSRQLENHFASIVNLCTTMIDGIVKHTPPDSIPEYGEEMIDELALSGKVRNFSYLAFLTKDGELEIIYGEPVTMKNTDLLQKSLDEDEPNLVTGITASGETLMLFGSKAAYPMKNGEKSSALIAGIPIQFLNSSMSLMRDTTLVYSHVILKDGSYVLRNETNISDNYFEWLKTLTFVDRTPEEALSYIKNAMANDEEFSIMEVVNGQRRNIYGVPLNNAGGWYLITVMLYGNLDETVADLGEDHLFASITSCILILVLLGFVFLLYSRISHRQLEETKKEKQRADHANLAKSEFLSNMSHDIRTPMNAIVGLTAIASSNIDNKEAVQDALQRITLSSKHLLGLINDVLDMSKIETGKLTINYEHVSLREIMSGVVNIIQPQVSAKNQSFDIFIRDIQCENVLSDNVRLNQILINLLSNAVKYTNAEGSIYVVLSQEDSPKGEDFVRTHIWVHDNGIGMTKEFQERIFDSFVREDSGRVNQIEGSGLGMSITKYIVDAMHGTIEVKSELNKGSEFHVALDFEKITSEEDNMSLPVCSLLLIDDNEPLCEHAVRVLDEMGVQADWVSDGAKAIEIAQKRYDEHKGYDIALLDWQMPNMNGVEVARQLRQHLGEKIPILLISAYDWSDLENEARAVGINGFIGKPLFKSTLYYGLSPYLGENSEVQPISVEKPQYDFTGNHLLVAEDYDLNWEICNTLLSTYGFELDWAENGKICVEMFNNSEPGYYDAILMDLRMPIMNGYEATTEIRASQRPDADIPIIAMTADAFAEDIQNCLDCGMNTHVAKPIDMKKMLEILNTYIN